MGGELTERMRENVNASEAADMILERDHAGTAGINLEREFAGIVGTAGIIQECEYAATAGIAGIILECNSKYGVAGEAEQEAEHEQRTVGASEDHNGEREVAVNLVPERKCEGVANILPEGTCGSVGTKQKDHTGNGTQGK